MDKKQGHAAMTCSMDMQYIRHGHVAWTRSMDMLQGHAAWACGMDMRHGHAAWTCGMDRRQGNAAWTCSMNMQQRHYGKTCSMDMQYGHAGCTCIYIYTFFYTYMHICIQYILICSKNFVSFRFAEFLAKFRQNETKHGLGKTKFWRNFVS
jgi:hypothetical protein